MPERNIQTNKYDTASLLKMRKVYWLWRYSNLKWTIYLMSTIERNIRVIQPLDPTWSTALRIIWPMAIEFGEARERHQPIQIWMEV